MEEYLEKVKNAKIEEIIPIYKVIEGPINAVEFFANLSNYGTKKHSILLESADIVPKYGTAGYAPGAVALKTNGTIGLGIYINRGTKDSCDFWSED